MMGGAAPTSEAPAPGGASLATVNYNGLIGFNATDPYAITAESRSGAFSLSIGTQVLMCLLYGILAFTAITSNMIVSYIVLSNSKMRTATNFFIVNLALGDILMALLCIPFTFPANLIFQYWPFGLSLCVIVSYSQANSVFISAYTMVAISIDKYMAIMYPMRLRMPKTQAKLIILAIWSAALLTSLPTALLSSLAPDSLEEQPARGQAAAEPREQPQRKYFCQESWSFWPPGQYYYSMALMILQYVLPLFVLVITYSRIVIIVWGKRMPGEEDNARDARMARSKRKMIKMVILCVIAFALTWLPFNALIVIGDIQPNVWEHENIMLIWFGTHYLAMCHTITNPLIYIWMNNRFRQGFKQVIGDLCWQTRRLLALAWFRCCCCGCLLRAPRLRHLEQARRLRQQRSLARPPPANSNTGAQNQSSNQNQNQSQSNTAAAAQQAIANHVQRCHQQRPLAGSSSTTTGTGSGGGEPLTSIQEPEQAGAGSGDITCRRGCGSQAQSAPAEGRRGRRQDKEEARASRKARRRRPHQIQIQMVVRGGGGAGATSGRKPGAPEGACVVEVGPASDHSSCTNSPATNTTCLSLTLQHHRHQQQQLRGRQVTSGSRSVVRRALRACGDAKLGARRDDTTDLESGDSRATDEDVCELEAFKSRSRSQSQSHAMHSSQSRSRSQYHPAHSKSNNNVSLGGCATSSRRRVKSNGSLELLSDGDRSSSASDEDEAQDQDEDQDDQDSNRDDRSDDGRELSSEFGDDDDDDGRWPAGAQVFEMATLAVSSARCERLGAPTEGGSAHVGRHRNDPDAGGRLRLLKRLFRSTQDDLFRRERSPGRRHHRARSNGLASLASRGRRQDRSLRRAMLLNNHLLTCSLRRIPMSLGGSAGGLGADPEPPLAPAQCGPAAPACPGTNPSSPSSRRQTGAASSIFKAPPRGLHRLAGRPTAVSRLLDDADSDGEEEEEDGLGDDDDDDDEDARTVVRKSPTVYLINGNGERAG